jgi:hypothetical protein
LWSSADAVTWEIIPASDVFKASAGTQHLDEILSGSNDEPWVIVGRAGSAEGTDGYSASGYAPVAWYSPDGLRWAQAEVEPAGPAGSRMNAVVHSQSGWLAVGTASWSAREVPVVWRSADARAWTVVRDAIPGPGFLQCVSNAPGQIVAAGSSNGVATAWQSADGVVWSPLELPSTRVARTVEGASFRVDGSLLLVGGTRANDPSQFAAAWDSQ